MEETDPAVLLCRSDQEEFRGTQRELQIGRERDTETKNGEVGKEREDGR